MARREASAPSAVWLVGAVRERVLRRICGALRRPLLGAGPGGHAVAEEEKAQRADGIGDLERAVVIGTGGIEASGRILSQEEEAEGLHGVRELHRAVPVGVSPPEDRIDLRR